MLYQGGCTISLPGLIVGGAVLSSLTPTVTTSIVAFSAVGLGLNVATAFVCVFVKVCREGLCC
jgi:hypothetical protein